MPVYKKPKPETVKPEIVIPGEHDQISATESKESVFDPTDPEVVAIVKTLDPVSETENSNQDQSIYYEDPIIQTPVILTEPITEIQVSPPIGVYKANPHIDTKLPEYATSGSACFDITA